MSEEYYILKKRWFDSSRGVWTDWEQIDEYTLQRKYGKTIDDWKLSCKDWIDIGGTYEYKIVKRTDTVEWTLKFSEKDK